MRHTTRRLQVRQQAVEATRAADKLIDSIFRNKNLNIETEAKINKTTIRLILTHAA